MPLENVLALKPGLNLETIKLHSDRINKILSGKLECPKFELIDTCRIDNKRILCLEENAFVSEKNENDQFIDYISFVPAAGAASRYIGPLQNLPKLMQENKVDQIKEKYRDMYDSGVLFPESIGAFLGALFVSENGSELCASYLNQVNESIHKPKAFYPCFGKKSYLDLKYLETLAVGSFGGQVYISTCKG